MQTDSPQEKALELVADNRVILVADRIDLGLNRVYAAALVAGESGHYDVMADQDGVFCSCPSRKRYCSHALAAMILWEEKSASHDHV